MSSPDDTLRWADGTTCTREEYDRGEFAFMSDDFEVLPVEGAQQQWKVIGTDNLNRETVADSLIDPGPLSKEAAEALADGLNERDNKHIGDGPGTWYTAVKMAYRLRRGMEDFM